MVGVVEGVGVGGAPGAVQVCLVLAVPMGAAGPGVFSLHKVRLSDGLVERELLRASAAVTIDVLLSADATGATQRSCSV